VTASPTSVEGWWCAAWRRVVRGVAAVALLCTGCPPPARVPLIRPIDESIAAIEANASRLAVGLKARGSVRGHFRDDRGTGRHYDLSGVLQVYPPESMRWVMKSALGYDELEAGTNAQKWWVLVSRGEAQYREGCMGDEVTWHDSESAVDPRVFVEALGLKAVGLDAGVRRVNDGQQQILMVTPRAEGGVIRAEYWVDRYEPGLAARVVFRDAAGRETFHSELSDYRPIADAGGYLPYRIRLNWPAQDAALELRVDRWTVEPGLSPGHRAFVSPHDRGGRYPHESIADCD